MSRTSATTGTLNRLSSDTFMGDTFESLSATKRNVVLNASIDYLIEIDLEIGANFFVEIPATSTVEIAAFVNPSDGQFTRATLTDTFMGQIFDSTSGLTRNVTLTPVTDFVVPETIEISTNFNLEIPNTSSLEVLVYDSNKLANDTTLYFANGQFDYIESGCVWTADAAGSSLNATMSPGAVWIKGKRLLVAGVISRAFTASTDTYVDFSDNGDGTALIAYTTTTNNAAAGSPYLINGVRNAIIVSGAGNIAAAASINQGQETIILPIVSSRPYAVTDSLGNLICPRDPLRKLLGLGQTLSTLSTASTTVQAAPTLICPVIIPANRKIILSFKGSGASNTLTTGYVEVSVWDGVAGSGTELDIIDEGQTTAAGLSSLYGSIVITPTASSKTYSVGYRAVAAGTASIAGSATRPIQFRVELE